jgi:catechol 2,3-dioxygenase-like lactoylglutathione lyase family enzyme
VKLNHLDLQSHDVQTLATFFVHHFDLERVSNDRSPAIVILHDGAGFTLVIQRRTDEHPYPAGFHLGFIHDRAAVVEAHHARLTAAGLRMSPIDRNARGTRFYVKAPEDILIEVSSPER